MCVQEQNKVSVPRDFPGEKSALDYPPSSWDWESLSEEETQADKNKKNVEKWSSDVICRASNTEKVHLSCGGGEMRVVFQQPSQRIRVTDLVYLFLEDHAEMFLSLKM